MIYTDMVSSRKKKTFIHFYFVNSLKTFEFHDTTAFEIQKNIYTQGVTVPEGSDMVSC